MPWAKNLIKYIGEPKYSVKTCVHQHSITQGRGPSKYNNEMLGAQFEFESPYATFLLFLYFESHITRAKH